MNARKILTIAKSEFLSNVTRKSFIFAMIAMPLTLGLMAGIINFVRKTQLKESRVAIVDQSGKLDFQGALSLADGTQPKDNDLGSLPQGGRAQFTFYKSVDEALADMRKGTLNACYVIGPDYPSSPTVTAYTKEKGLIVDLFMPGQQTFLSLLRGALGRGHVDPELLQRMLTPASLDEVRMSKLGRLKPIHGDLSKTSGLMMSMGLFLLFAISIFMLSNYLLQGTAEEKENRVIEAVLAIVKPIELLLGKLLGLGATGLVQIAIYTLCVFGPALATLGGTEMTWPRLMLSMAFFFLGLLLFAALMASIGMIANTVREGTQLAASWTIASLVPFLLMQPISQTPDAPWVRALALFPLTAPLTMLVRINVGAIHPVETLVSMLVLVLSIVLAIRAGAVIFRAASLMTGKRADLAQVVRWLREA